MSKILPFIGKDAKECKELADTIDNLIFEHMSKGVTAGIIAGVIAHRLGAWIGHIIKVEGDSYKGLRLLKECKSIMDKQMGGQ